MKSPNLQLHWGPVTTDETFFQNVNTKPEIFEKHVKKYLKIYNNGSRGQFYSIFCNPTLINPQSVGDIQLQSSDPLVHPLINPQYLTNAYDIQVLVEGCKLVNKIFSTEPLKSQIESLITEINECNEKEYTNEWWKYYVQSLSITIYHPTSTCKMGPHSDETTVITPDCRVKGVKGLRVVDASIMPKIVSGNTNIPTIALAERASDLIKGKIIVSG
ncbi:unnamed protein product [Didymodactylos carnosus]|uniref:Glucose-methanol-choline oxidoreductase C-terminal domain-containing protein n=1 Tax=Didymodactylos carnosus TaxID=1234261 RepID=A0A815DMA0_9BILA|nr:unnamed protein product [Didymodactylos carnosus]CAF4120512.1 unnamed protein product [Didymodactylos carnosus]